MRRRIAIVAGEASGDAHGARLALALARADPTVELCGMGGERMRAAGVATFIDSRELSIMGFAELAGGLARAARAYRSLVRQLRSAARPDLLVLIDFPDFNLRLARAARRAGVRILYYVSPQVWAWRRGRIRKICRLVDRMIVLFPFEAALYRDCGLDTHFVGHPLAEEVVATRAPQETRRHWAIPETLPLVALLPGSRRAEVERMLPLMLEAARKLEGRAVFAIAKAPDLPAGLVERLVADAGVPVATVEDDTYNLLVAARAAAVTSGTATVETAVLGCPMVVVYRMSRLSYAIARRLVRVPFIAMPNIIAGERVVPELIQDAATPQALADEITVFLDSDSARERTATRLARVRDELVMPGAADRVARLVLEMVA